MTLDFLVQKNPFLMTTIRDFNTKSKNWYSHDKTSFEGKTIESTTSWFGLYQLINEPTHLLENSSSCIDLIFTSQSNLDWKHETLTCNDKNPPWFNSRIKSLLQDKNKLYKDFRRSNSNAQLLNKLNHLQEQLNFLINRSKQYYYARMTKKLTNVSKNCKTYWSLLRRLLNNKKYL